jgi:hypothetical protein
VRGLTPIPPRAFAGVSRAITSAVDITSPKMRSMLASVALCSSSVAAAFASETITVL